MAHYGLHLAEEVWANGIPARRLWALVRHLPPESPVWANEGWTHRDEIAARTMELVDGWGRIQATVAGADPKKLPKDAREYGARIQRPETPRAEKPKKKITTDTAEIAAFFRQYH